MSASVLALASLGLYFMPLAGVGRHTSHDVAEMIAFQSGWQAASGRMTWALGKSIRLETDSELSPAPLMIAYPLVLLGCLIIGIVPANAATRFGVAFFCCALGAAFLLGQMVVGFPAAHVFGAGLRLDADMPYRAHYTLFAGMSFVFQAVGILLSGAEFFVAKRRRLNR